MKDCVMENVYGATERVECLAHTGLGLWAVGVGAVVLAGVGVLMRLAAKDQS